MGCGASSSKKNGVVDAPAVPAAPQVVQAPQHAKAGKSRINKAGKFQWKSGSGWNDYDGSTDAKLKQAYLVGRPNARFDIKTPKGVENYDFSFKKDGMTQNNAKTNRPRDMRPPMGMDAPKEPVLPEGDFVVVTIGAKDVGKTEITIDHPRNKGEKIKVSIPARAKKGAKIAVPIPSASESLEDVAKKQQGMSSGAKAAMGTGVVVLTGAAVVGGVILGDHLAGGGMADVVAAGAVDGGEAVADFAVDAGEAIADWAPDAAEGLGDVAEDVGEWLGDAGEDIGDWICSVF